jgi:hypothetical protein
MAKDSEQAQQQARPATQRSRGSSEIVIELFDRRLGNDILVDPLRDKFRGRFVRSMQNGTAREEEASLNALPDIPGICFALDPVKKEVRLFDPMGLPGNAQRMTAFNAAMQQAGKQPFAPVPEKTIPLGTQDGVATWLYWMRRMVFEHKLAVHVPGSASLGVADPYLPGGVLNQAALEAGLPGDPTIDWDSSPYDNPKTLGEYKQALRRAGRPRDPAQT